jgi:hypothetical protein
MSVTLIFWILACAGSPAPPATSNNVTETATLVDDDQEAQVLDLGLSLMVPADMSTVIRASWAGGAATGDVYYDDGATLRRAVPTETASGWEVWLLGSEPGAEVDVWVEGELDGVAFASELVSAVTTALPQDLPVPEGRELSGMAASGDLVIVSYSGQTTHGAVLYNGAGQAVWAWEAQPGYGVTGTTWCGTGPCVLLERTGDRHQDNLILQLGAEGETLRTIEAPYAHHDLAMTDDGAIVWLQSAPQDTAEHGKVYGDRLIRTEANGEESVVWDSWETLPVVVGTQWAGRYYDDGRDWTHANGIDERDGDWIISLGGLATIIEIDGQTGEILRTLEGQNPDLGDARFDMQHSPSWTPDGTLLLFVNGGPGGPSSWVAEFEVDGETLREVWHTDRAGPISTSALGHTWRQIDGRTLVDFGQVPVVQQLDLDGQPQWELEFSEGTWTTQVRPVEMFTVR